MTKNNLRDYKKAWTLTFFAISLMLGIAVAWELFGSYIYEILGLDKDSEITRLVVYISLMLVVILPFELVLKELRRISSESRDKK
ncbi:hypothetical protein [Chitiniphilus eburneus]|uniref:Uncharacterized protein n=1 Tax=Chitiniphilus eburneus TaxID=2571148 RepID=A0A4U0P8H8_9NEIS|nr:hypothetical protein [Chitiniphilus eburneus]TJZ63857.1 hypothetical protein FAZ21_19605 [Chitiniphilus eburneus]